ncbi:Putative E3 ubiquitin-protein ligase HERC1, partial [Durusdinium trenchii]
CADETFLEDQRYSSDFHRWIPPGHARVALPDRATEARTECVIDVVQATSYLGQGVVFLYRAIKYDGWQCPDNSNVGCAISVSGFIASMFWLASYLSLASSACADSLNSNGLCGADWLALTADFAEVANAGAGIQEATGATGLAPASTAGRVRVVAFPGSPMPCGARGAGRVGRIVTLAKTGSRCSTSPVMCQARRSWVARVGLGCGGGRH